MEIDQMTMEMDSTMETSGEQRKRPWEKPGGSKIKKKKVPGAKNFRVRKYVKPKNAVMCLNDLRSGLVYTTEQEGTVGTPFCISVIVDEKTYRGYGSSKQLAKQAAAEAALVSFVQPPISSGEPSEDKTPWVTLASFAIYKLFKEWREKPLGPPNSVTASYPYLANAGKHPSAVANPLSINTKSLIEHLENANVPAAPEVNIISNTQTNANDAARHPNPAKQVPANATSMHPVMVLHQMRPGLNYIVDQTTKDNQRFYHMSVIVDGQTFYGEGPTMKKAKFCLARDAIKVLFDIESAYDSSP